MQSITALAFGSITLLCRLWSQSYILLIFYMSCSFVELVLQVQGTKGYAMGLCSVFRLHTCCFWKQENFISGYRLNLFEVALQVLDGKRFSTDCGFEFRLFDFELQLQDARSGNYGCSIGAKLSKPQRILFHEAYD